MGIVHLAAGPRSELLHEQAYREEGMECPPVDESERPVALLYPRSYVDAVDALAQEKTYDYSFVGSVYRHTVLDHRRWILDFARRRFGPRSYFLATDADERHTSLGSFDRSHREHDVFVPIQRPWTERVFFHPLFFQVLRSSRFSLCPAGDQPWSMRFFESAMCRSMPIISDRRHVGRNEVERSIGYHTLFVYDEHVYDEELVEENYRLFLRHQTLIDR